MVLAGDGRHDSMGHSAKYGTYTIFCCTIGLIIHLVVIQANQAGSSSAMEALDTKNITFSFDQWFGYNNLYFRSACNNSQMDERNMSTKI